MEKNRNKNRKELKLRRLIRKRLELIMAGIGIYSVRQRRKKLSDYFMKKFNGEVRYGHFTGLKIIKDSSWIQNDKSSMLFGIYEKEVLDSLGSVPSKYTHFINLGAADGYYGVGVVDSGMFGEASCYEIANDGQDVIRKTAYINGV